MPTRLFTISAILLALLLLLAAGLYALRAEVIGPRLLAAANTYLGPALGVELAAGKVGGNYLNSLILKDIYTVKKVAADGELPAFQPELEARQLRLRYQLPALRHGTEAFLATLRIELSRGRLTLQLPPGAEVDSEKTAALPEAAELQQLFATIVELAALLPAISLDRVDLRLQSQDLALAANDLALSFFPATDPAKDTSRLTLQSGSFSLQHPRLQLLQAPLALELQAGGDKQDGSLTISRLEWQNLLAVSTGRLSWSEPPAGEVNLYDPLNQPAQAIPELDLEVQLQLLETALHGRATLTPDHWRGELATGSFNLARLAEFWFEPPRLSGKVTLASRLEMAPAAPWETLSGELELQLAQGAVAEHRLDDLELQARFRQGELQLARLTAGLADNRLELAQLHLPLPALLAADLKQLLHRSRLAELRLDFRNLPELLNAAGLEAATLIPAPFLELTRQQLQLQAGLEHGLLQVRELNLINDTGRLTIPRAVIGPWPPDDDYWQLPVEGEAHLEISNLGEFTRRWQLPALSGRLQGELAVQGIPSDPRGFVILEAADLRRPGLELDHLQLTLRGDRQQLHLERLHLKHDTDYFQAGLTVDPSPLLEAVLAKEPIAATAEGSEGKKPSPAINLEKLLAALNWENLQVSFNFADLAAYHELLPPAWHTGGRLQGELSGDGTLEQPRLTANLQLYDLQLPAGDRPAPWPKLDQVTADLQLAEQQLQVKQFSVRRHHDRLQVAGRLRLPGYRLPELPEPAAMELQELEITLAVSELAAYADLLPPPLQPAVPPAPLPIATGEEPAAEAGTAPPAGRGLDGALTARVQGGGTLTDHAFTATAELTRGRLADFRLQSFSGQAEFRLPGGDPGALQLTGSFQAQELYRQADLLVRELSSDLGYTAGRLTVTRGKASNDQGRLRMGGEMHGLGTETLTLHFNQLELATDDLTLILAAPARLHFSGGRLHDAELEMTGLGAYLHLQGGYDPNAPGAELDFQARLRSDELSWLGPLLPGVRRLEGKVAAELELFGSPADPQVRGTFELEEGELRPEGDTPAFREIRARADFDAQGLELRYIDGQWSGAPLTIRGRVDFPPAFPLAFSGDNISRELRLNLTLQGEELLFYRAEGIRLRGRTDLNLTGPLAALHLAGEVAISEGRYTRNVDFLEMFRAPGGPRRSGGLQLFSLTAPPWREMTFNIRIIADHPFTVANNMARGSLRPNLRLGGSGELPVLTGEIYLDPTRLTLPSGRFQIESGLIRFPEQDPDRPEFDLLATARLLGYDINMVLQGTADEPVLTLSSTPPLGDDELLLLVLTGQPPSALGHETARRRAGMNMAVFLGRDLLARIFHGDDPPSDEAILERFHIDVGRDITRRGDETIEAELRLVDDLIRPGNRLFITSEKDVYDDFNIGLKIVFRFR